MQHIGIKIENENGDTMESSELNFAEFFNKFFKVFRNEEVNKEFPFLLSIDPYGDTILNRSQTQKLIEELKKLKINN